MHVAYRLQLAQENDEMVRLTLKKEKCDVQ
jgi:hypothetical protein